MWTHPSFAFERMWPVLANTITFVWFLFLLIVVYTTPNFFLPTAFCSMLVTVPVYAGIELYLDHRGDQRTRRTHV